TDFLISRLCLPGGIHPAFHTGLFKLNPSGVEMFDGVNRIERVYRFTPISTVMVNDRGGRISRHRREFLLFLGVVIQ
ncbi:hypothetical protein BWI93_10745, partial [Siphonobacter sp. BAB-5385]